MTDFATTRAAGPSFWDWAQRLIAAVAAWHERRVTRDELYRLSDRELDDIGLTRGDIDLVVDRLH